MLQALPPGQSDVTQESSHEALARHRSLCGSEALAFLRVIPSDPARIIPPLECVSAFRRLLGIDTFLAQRPGTDCQARATSTRQFDSSRGLVAEQRLTHTLSTAVPAAYATGRYR